MARMRLCVAAVLAAAASSTAAAQDAPAVGPPVPAPELRASVVAGMANMLTLERPGQQGLATVADGNKCVQCRRMAALLLPCLRVGRAALVARLGHEDSARADREACAAGETRLRSGPGWELWCFDEVIRACEVSAAEHAPVVFLYF